MAIIQSSVCACVCHGRQASWASQRARATYSSLHGGGYQQAGAQMQQHSRAFPLNGLRSTFLRARAYRTTRGAK